MMFKQALSIAFLAVLTATGVAEGARSESTESSVVRPIATSFTKRDVQQAVVNARALVVRECRRQRMLTDGEFIQTLTKPVEARVASFKMLATCPTSPENRRLLEEFLTQAWLIHDTVMSGWMWSISLQEVAKRWHLERATR